MSRSLSAPLIVSGITPSPGANVQPSSAISQLTIETEIMPASPFRLRMMSVRCAQGQASET